MKTWILAMAMMVAVGVNAQDKKERPEPLKPEQRVELQVKKMTLALDLNSEQQKNIEKLLLDKSKERQLAREHYKTQKQAGKKLTSDERFAMRSKMLDDKIAMKSAMKNILTKEQFEKFDKMKKKKHHKMTARKERHENFNRK